MPQTQREPAQEFVKVKSKYQLTLPTSLRRSLGVDVGDLFRASVQGGALVLTPAQVLDRDLAESLRDVAEGRTYGPFDTVDALFDSLEANKPKDEK